MKFNLFFLLLIFNTAILSAQDKTGFTLSGKVYNNVTKQPVDFATIIILEAKQKAFTKQDGSYSITVPQEGEYTVIVRTSGLKILKIKMKINKDIKRDFRMVPFTIKGGKMIIKGERDIQKISRHTMTVQDLKSVPGALGDAINALTVLPGVIKPFGFFGGLVIRGKDSSTHSYFIDDIPLFSPMHYGGFHAVINNNFMKEIDLFSSAFPVSYGSATSAVISINTLDEVNEFGGYTDVGLISMSALIMTPIYTGDENNLALAGPDYIHDKNKKDKKGYVIASARYGYLTLAIYLLDLIYPSDQEILPEYWDYQAKMKYYINKNNSLILLFYGSSDYLRVKIKIDEEGEKEQREEREYEDDPLMLNINFKMDLKIHSQGLFYSYEPSKRFANTLKFYSVLNQNYLYIGFKGENLPTALDGINIDARPNIFGIKNKTRLEWWENHAELRFGEEFTFYKFTGKGKLFYINPGKIDEGQGHGPPGNEAFYTYEFDEDIENRLVSGFIENKFTFAGLTFLPGFRSDWLQRSDVYTTDPRALLSYEFPTKTTLSAAYGRYSYFFQVNPQVFNGNMDIAKLGKELKPEKAIHHVVGIEQEIDLYTIKIEGFNNYFYDRPMQYPHTDQDGNFRQGLSSGKTVTKGLEVMIRKNRQKNSDGQFGWLSYTFTGAKDRTDLPTEPGYLGVASNLVGDPNGDKWFHSNTEQRHNIKLIGGSVYKGHTISIRAEYYTSFPYTPIVGSELDEAYYKLTLKDNPDDPTSRYLPVYGEKNSAHFPNFFSLDVRYSYITHYSWGYVTWYIEVINALNNQPISQQNWDRSQPYQKGVNPVLEAPEGAIINFIPIFGAEVKF